MKLFYRGISYEYEPAHIVSKKTGRPFQPVETSGASYNLIYRGHTYRVNPNTIPTEDSTPSKAYQLIYRGIAYSVNETAQGNVTVVSQPASTVKKWYNSQLVNS
ncbi:hypothetical protein BZZ01_05995 [Nostocales cyanobacterium HT-58-2]|nr:hypothetical protein BZZ01_05995 [Nostocales cyanobacterium HT-58-2]